MTLRIMLVGLVASLGFEPPTGSDVSGWVQAGKAWVQARMLDRSGPEVELKLDLAGPSDCQRVDLKFEVPPLVCEKEGASDSAFKAVLDGIATDLSADLLANHREEAPSDQVASKLAIEAPAPVPLAEAEDVGCLIVPVDEAKTAEVAWTGEDKPADSVESTIGLPERPDRVSSAVRLTREAIQAWADLMQQPFEACQPTR
jgi:hypothetical protein